MACKIGMGKVKVHLDSIDTDPGPGSRVHACRGWGIAQEELIKVA